MTTQPNVIIAGHGQMGHAFESLLQERADIRIWDVAPERTLLSPDLETRLHSADFVFLCVPTLAHAALLTKLSPILPPAAAVLSIAKGLDDAGSTAADILLACLETRPWGVLGGPMIANEIIAGRVGFAELGTLDRALPERITALFAAMPLRVSHASSATAVSWCGVLKNIYAPLIGIADELAWGDNARGHIVMASVAEMRSLLSILTDATQETYGDAGLADFITTVTSAHSHHYSLGRSVARGESKLPDCEGLHSLRVMQALRRVDDRAHRLYAVAAGLVSEPAGVPDELHRWLLQAR